jgi:hypothetical protein
VNDRHDTNAEEQVARQEMKDRSSSRLAADEE